MNTSEKVLAGVKTPDTAQEGANIVKMIGSGASPARLQFIERFKELPKNVQEGLLDGSMQVVDHALFVTAVLDTASTAQLFKRDDDESVGVRNVAKGKVADNEPFLMTGFQVLYANAAPGVFASAAHPTEIANAEINLRYNSQDVLKQFPVQSLTGGLSGYDVNKKYAYKELDHAKLFLPSKSLEGSIDLATAFAAGTHSVRLVLFGATVRPFAKN